MLLLMRQTIILFLTCLMFLRSSGQDTLSVKKEDSLTPVLKDSVLPPKDTVRVKKAISLSQPDTARKDSVTITDSAMALRPVTLKPIESLYVTSPFPTVYGEYAGGFLRNDDRFKPTKPVIRVSEIRRIAPGVEWMFYLFCGILLLLSFLRLAFFKYFIDLFKVFFNTSMRQKQIKEQLSQSPLPSLLLNIFFFIIGGVFIYFLMAHFSLRPNRHVAIVLIFSVLGLAALYLGKYVFITLLGWTFDKKMAAENYLFVVFMVNKMAGLFLLPMTVLMAYTENGSRQVVITLTVIGLIVLLLMRLARAYSSVNHILKINLLHFIVFVGAFEVIPVLLLYKVLLMFIY